jgi:hypothetical protein
MSDGSSFAGSLSVGIDQNGHQTMAISGTNLVAQQPGLGASLGLPSIVTVTATQNGSSFLAMIDLQVS